MALNLKLVIIGGPNGAGKSTFAYQYEKECGIEYLAADELAGEIANKKLKNIELQAGKLFFRRLQDYLKTKKSVIIESTLSGLGLKKILEKFKKSGYSIKIVFIFLDSVEFCKNRIEIRAKKGGHKVPSKDVERRFYRSIKNFWTTYRFVADSWQILYNGKERPIEAAFNEENSILVADEEYYQIFMDLIS
jgi:predicted ABC-type ATPase